MTSALLGIDLGTTEAKAGLFDVDGRPLASARVAYPTDVGPDGKAEQDPTDWWSAVSAAVRQLDAAAVDVLGICGVGQGPTLAALDAEARPVRPAITWRDRRIVDPGFGLLPKLSWLARHDPRAATGARWLLSSWDALGLWLSGAAVTSIQGHERPLALDAIRSVGVDPALIPPPLAFGSRLGSLRAEAAARLGLPPGIPVIAGVNDGTSSMLGAGLLAAGDAVDTGGASGGFGIYADREMHVPGVFSAPAPIEGRWVLGGAMAATGAALDWLAGPVLGNRWSLAQLLVEAADVPAGADGLVFLPYLAGERAPIFDEHARGVFFGLTLHHGRGHLVRAVLEGAAFAIRHVAEPIVAAGLPVREMRLAGGPARSELWSRIKADVTGFPVALPRVGDTAVMGAAILAAAGVGLVPDLKEGVLRMTAIERRIQPDAEAHAVYDRQYATYRALYPALASLGKPDA